MENADAPKYRVPNGPTQRTWFSEGYRAALIDVAHELSAGGERAAREWIESNYPGVRWPA